MPNWAMGSVEVTGKAAGVISFIERFLDWYDREEPRKKYFARSVVDEDRSSLIEQARYESSGRPENEDIRLVFGASFAWSAYSCLISGYPESNPDACISLEQACREDGVSVQIYTEEPGIYFEEDLQCDADGNVNYSCEDLISARCRHCGATQGISSRANLDEVECYDCGNTGFEYVIEQEEA